MTIFIIEQEEYVKFFILSFEDYIGIILNRMSY